MTDHAIAKDWPDSIAFDRLHALAQRGYQAELGSAGDDSGFAHIDLVHPRTKGKKLPPPHVTLWSNGILSTREVLWPKAYAAQKAYVAQDDGPPDWQKFIDTNDSTGFSGFLESVPLPSYRDLFVDPFLRRAKVLMARFTFGATLCVILGFVGRVCLWRALNLA